MQFIRNGNLSLALERRGSGPRRLLFLHGWISSRRMFYDVVARLDPDATSSFLLDFRGNGLSDRTENGHDVEGYASDLRAAAAVIDGPFEIVAHSMGGKVSQYVALDPPDRLRRLILIAPGSAKPPRPSAAHRALAEAAFGSRNGIDRFQRAAMKRELPPETMQRIVDDALIAQREAWFGWYDGGRAEDFFDRVGSIALPTLVVAGDGDPLAPPMNLRRDVTAAIPGARMVTIRNVGHNIPVEAPEEVAQLLAHLPPIA